MDMTTRCLTDSELRAIPPLQFPPQGAVRHERNPCLGTVNAHRWCIVHGWAEDPEALPSAEPDPFEELFAAVDPASSPFYNSTDPVTGDVLAVFPARTLSEADWEESSEAMHSRQAQIDPALLPEREPPETPNKPGALRRGD